MNTREQTRMIDVAPGVAQLSDRRTQRRWSIALESYRIGVYPVTRAEYLVTTGQPPPAADEGHLPAIDVSWWDAVRFCNALSRREGLSAAYRFGTEDSVEPDASSTGYRLPTEAEWEHACRAGTTGPRYGELDEIAWYRGNSQEQPHPVGGKHPNAWGLHDMLGNAWEWCWDIYDAEVYGSYRVLRGGGWFDEQWSCRASVRRRSHPTLRLDDVGFRLARSGH
ncbi:formylglycine-generating enzyme family protein [Cryptosporangium arvum]